MRQVMYAIRSNMGKYKIGKYIQCILHIAFLIIQTYDNMLSVRRIV